MGLTDISYEERRFGDWIISSKGNRLYPCDLRPGDIDIVEIAHALSNICRFGGHCKEFYSVAQHSVIVSQLVQDRLDWELSGDSDPASIEHDLPLIGLLHDATEAYCGDMVRPLKQMIPQFSDIEKSIWRAIAERYRFPEEIPQIVQIEDARCLLIEKRDIIIHHEHRWEFPQCAFPDLNIPGFVIVPQSPTEARELFLNMYYKLISQKGDIK